MVSHRRTWGAYESNLPSKIVAIPVMITALALLALAAILSVASCHQPDQLQPSFTVRG